MPSHRRTTSSTSMTLPSPTLHPVTVRKAPFPIALVLLYVPDLIHVTESSPGPTHFETKYGLYRRCTRKTPTSNTTSTFHTSPDSFWDTYVPGESTYILERADANDHARPHSLDRLQHLLESTQTIARSRHVASSPPAPTFASATESQHERVHTEGLEDTPIDGEGDDWVCTPFPQKSECARFGQKFSGYAAQLALAPCVVALIALLVITVGIGSRKVRAKRRRGGWKIVSILMSVHAVLQIISIAIILHVYRTDPRFRGEKSHLDKACDFAVASAVISVGTVLALALTGAAAEAGKTWAAGKSAKRLGKKRHYHRRTRSGRVVAIPGGEEVDEETALLDEPVEDQGEVRATGSGAGLA
ncbi:hypothetical protein QFC20_005428 [Naganishia adeliensis]|uniref:Uncharacterized protein n=1 Tax=Naganishia adeliensis TaxID=92952 RepID=A0ACC2VN69_9TREE|nr:hypothetical protein QFC20_005428 [Naganishia adeliensis]